MLVMVDEFISTVLLFNNRSSAPSNTKRCKLDEVVDVEMRILFASKSQWSPSIVYYPEEIVLTNCFLISLLAMLKRATY